MTRYGYTLSRPTGFSCPECGGAMSTDHVGSLLQFRCHIGHVFTAEVTLAAQFRVLEDRLGSCLALMNERAEVCRLLAGRVQPGTEAEDALQRARAETLQRANVICELLEASWIHPEGSIK